MKQKDQLLANVITKLDLEEIEKLLKEGANPNALDKNGNPLLYPAITSNNLGIVKALLDYGANPNVLDKDGKPILSQSIATERIDILNALLINGADPNLRGADIPVLLRAANIRELDAVKALLDYVSVDIQSGMINKVAVTPANVTDSKGFKHVMPSSGATYVDKGYCTISTKNAAAKKGVHLCAIKKNNMKDKNCDLDKYYTKIRAPFEMVFSKDNKRVRYIGIAKNQFSEFMNAICFNLKRLVVLTTLMA